MEPIDDHMNEIENWEYAETVSHKANPMKKNTVKGSQFEQPLLEFSGACAGCGETPYIKLLTQLFGDRMQISMQPVVARFGAVLHRQHHM